MQDIELVNSGFVLCDDCRVVSTAVLMESQEPPVKSYRVVQILDNSVYHVGDRVVTSGEGANIRLKNNPTEYWMFDINAIVGKLSKG